MERHQPLTRVDPECAVQARRDLERHVLGEAIKHPGEQDRACGQQTSTMMGNDQRRPRFQRSGRAHCRKKEASRNLDVDIQFSFGRVEHGLHLLANIQKSLFPSAYGFIPHFKVFLGTLLFRSFLDHPLLSHPQRGFVIDTTLLARSP